VTKNDVADFVRKMEPGIENANIKTRIVELTGLDPSTEEPNKVLTALVKAAKK